MQRLQAFLFKQFGTGFSIQTLTPDASTREYFRVGWSRPATAIACVYPEPFAPENQTYLDVSNLLAISGLPVPEIYAFDGERGIIVQEDMGDKTLRQVLRESDKSERDNLINQAITLIAEIQAATEKAFELDSVASRLKFDEEKLNWEFDFFTKHYFESLRQKPLNESDAVALKKELSEVSRELAVRAGVLCHRDFHAANLMIDDENRLRIIDHQDARLGSTSYDLVSLLLDRISETPSADFLQEKQLFLLAEREKLGLEKLDAVEFAEEFQLQTIQRCLKAIGTFSFQTAMRGKTGYTPYINPMFQVVAEAAESLNRFPNLQKVISRELNIVGSI